MRRDLQAFMLSEGGLLAFAGPAPLVSWAMGQSIRYAFPSGSVSPFVVVINRICRLIVKRKGMEEVNNKADIGSALLVSMSF